MCLHELGENGKGIRHGGYLNYNGTFVKFSIKVENKETFKRYFANVSEPFTVLRLPFA